MNNQQTIELKLDLACRDVLRMMGGSHRQPVRPEILDLVSQLLVEAIPHIRARAVYEIRHVVQMTDHQLTLDGVPGFNGPIADFLRPAKRVVLFVVTIGNGIEELAEARRAAGKTLEAYTLQGIGSAAADAAIDAFVDHLWTREAGPGEAVSPPFSPGYCGLPITEQKTLFSILDTRPIGVSLLPSMIMVPIKSISGMVGIGNALEIEARGLPCNYCDLDRCQMRRGERRR